jgi:hypothetical protein
MKLKIEQIDGSVHECRITPRLEVAFELKWKGGFAKLFREQEKSEHLYWLAWEALRQNDVVVPVFGDKFLESLVSVDLADDDPNG